jgi:hypothetical protein
MTRPPARRRDRGRPDLELALALLRIEAAFGPVEVLEVRPNPLHPISASTNRGDGKRPPGEQAAFDLDPAAEEG